MGFEFWYSFLRYDTNSGKWALGIYHISTEVVTDGIVFVVMLWIVMGVATWVQDYYLRLCV